MAAEPAAGTVSCDIAAASPWIEHWFGAWELASRQILKLPAAPAPEIVLYDGTCAWTTSVPGAERAPVVAGPQVGGESLPWRAFLHGGTLTLPDGSTTPIQLMSFTASAKETGPFFVMAAPAYWAETTKLEPSGLTGVFLHEFAHTRQVEAVAWMLGPLDASWPNPDELDDNVVQTRFQGDPEYVAAYTAERDLLYKAADAPSRDEALAHAREALAMMKNRHARWFTGDDARFAAADDLWLTMEGVGQWTAYAWLAHPDGGGLARDAAIATMLGRRRWWVQDEGLALMLVVDRLMPGWPELAFTSPAPGATSLLERAVRD